MTTARRWTIGGAAGAMLLAQAGPLLAQPLPKDPRVREGALPNGVKWMYRQHDNPPGRMELMIHVDTGSLNETDAQRGLAHFLEHMCFNGTEHFAPGDLIPYFESIGMEFGGDLNAFTSFDQTAYMLSTPDTKVNQVGKALMVLSDYAFRALLLTEEIDKERGVILEEKRTRKSAFQRIQDELYPELYEGSRFAQRLVIGDEEVIANAPRKQFADYYRTWYRPANVTVFMVGDALPDKYIPLIEKWFGEYRPQTPMRSPYGPEFQTFTKQRAIVVTDPELTRCSVELVNIRPGRPPTTTVQQARVELVERIGNWIVNRRYGEMVNKGEASFRRGSAGVRDFFHDAIRIGASASGEPEDWAKMLEQLVVEVSRAREHGMTERELELAKTQILARADRAVKTEPTMSARRIIRSMMSAVNEEVPIRSARQKLDLLTQLLPSVTLSEVQNTFTAHFKPGTFAYVVQTPQKPDLTIPTRDEVLAAARAAWARKTTPPARAEKLPQLLAALPKPGKVVDKTVDADLGITSTYLSNGVRVHHRFMDYKKDEISISISLAGGPIEETPGNVGISQVAALAISQAATARLTSTQMRDIMTGRNINVRPSGGADTFGLSVSGSPADVEMGLQKAHALLTAGRIEESAFDNWKLSTLQFIAMRETMPRFKAMEAMRDLVTGGDHRRSFLTEQNVAALTRDKAQAWYDRLCRKAPIEVAVVGDMAYDDIMPLIERYLGSLPTRQRTAEHMDKLRKHARSTGPLVSHITVDTMTPQAMSMTGFMSADAHHTSDTRAMSLASNILSSRVVKRIREDLSLVYSIRARHSADWAYQDSSTFTAGAPCDPDNANRVVTEARAIFQAFADKGPTAEELENAKKQIANNLDDQMREPRYWLNVLRNLDLHRRNLKDEKTKRDDFNAYTVEQVHRVFKKYYTPQRRFTVTALPKKPSTTRGEKTKKETSAP